MRIGIFSDTYLPDINGVVTSIETLRKGLMEQGHEVFIIANHKNAFKHKYEDRVLLLAGLELKKFDYKKLSSPIQGSAWDYVRQMRLDIIHVQQEFGVGLFARWVAKRLNIPLVYTYHTQYEDYTHYLNIFKSQSFDRQTKRLVGWLSKELAQPAQIIIAPSQKTKMLLERYGVTKPIQVIPSGIDLRRFKESEELIQQRLHIREKYGITNQDTLFIFIGRISGEKDILVVLNGFKELVKSQPDCYFMIVGGGPELENYRQWIIENKLDKHIFTTGMVVNTDIAGYYHAGDIFVSASLSETQGLTFMEAMACGLPLLASDKKILEELLIEGKSGYYFDGSAEFVEKAHKILSSSDEQRQQLKQGALELVKPYEDRIFVDSVLECYYQALELHGFEYVIEEIELVNGYYHLLISTPRTSQSIYMSAQQLAQEELVVDQIIDKERVTVWMQRDLVDKLYTKAISLLVHKDYTETAMLESLENQSQDRDVNEIVMNKLKQANFINDQRFLQEQIERFKRLNIGNYKAKQRLERLKFKEEHIEEALESLQPLQVELCTKLFNNIVDRYQDLPILAQKQKLMSKATREGFELSVIYAALDEVNIREDRNQIYENLYHQVEKYYVKQRERRSAKEVREKTIARMSRKGYPLNLIIEVLNEVMENENK